MLDDFQRERDVETFPAASQRFNVGDAVIDREPARLGMGTGDVDRCRAGVDAGHGEAEPRHRLGDQPPAAADIDQREAIERPQSESITAEGRQQLAADEIEAGGVYPMEGAEAALRVPPARALRGEAIDVRPVYRVAEFIHTAGSPRPRG